MSVNHVFEKLKIFSTNDKRITHIGSVLHNKKSLAMWTLLITTNNEYHLKEMASIIEKTANPRLPIYEHHVKTMIDAGMIMISEKMHNKHITKFYRAAPILIITSPIFEKKIITHKSLKNSFLQILNYHNG